MDHGHTVDSRRDSLAERLWARWSQVLTGRVLDFKTTPTHLRAPVYEMADEVLMWHKEQLGLVPDGPFNYESIGDESVKTGPTPGFHYRIHDAKDNRIATCYDQDNARFIVGQLNGKK